MTSRTNPRRAAPPPPRARAALTPPRFPRPALALSWLRVYGSTHARFLVLMGVGGMYGFFYVLWGCVLRALWVFTYPVGVYVFWGCLHTLGICTVLLRTLGLYCVYFGDMYVPWGYIRYVMHGFFTYFGEMHGSYTCSGAVLNVLSAYLRTLEIRTFLIRTPVILHVHWELRPKVQ